MSNIKLQSSVLSKPRRHTHAAIEYDVQKSGLPKVSTRSQEFVYVNTGYVGSVNSVTDARLTLPARETSVIREQYWACSRWPAGQRILTIVVGVLLGAVIGLVLTVAFMGMKGKDVGDLFRTSPAPD